VVVSLLAILELVRSSIVTIRQDAPFAALVVFRAGAVATQAEREAIERAEY